MKFQENKKILIRLYNEYIKKHLSKIFFALVLSIIVAGTTSSIAWLLDPAVKKIFIDQSVVENIPMRLFNEYKKLVTRRVIYCAPKRSRTRGGSIFNFSFKKFIRSSIPDPVIADMGKIFFCNSSLKLVISSSIDS